MVWQTFGAVLLSSITGQLLRYIIIFIINLLRSGWVGHVTVCERREVTGKRREHHYDHHHYYQHDHHRYHHSHHQLVKIRLGL